jgi:hypothetical protein
VIGNGGELQQDLPIDQYTFCVTHVSPSALDAFGVNFFHSLLRDARVKANIACAFVFGVSQLCWWWGGIHVCR